MMLDFPELFVPNRPVIGARRIPSMERQDLKFLRLRDFNIESAPLGPAASHSFPESTF